MFYVHWDVKGFHSFAERVRLATADVESPELAAVFGDDFFVFESEIQGLFHSSTGGKTDEECDSRFSRFWFVGLEEFFPESYCLRLVDYFRLLKRF